ncbi:hypothetical protein Clacol_010089 [Clathrus columnatus]|uniref:Uncharacterized protein n=1 Tax=Clathrus columnatus TaxID=1419009 RepID=A0AAV5AME1_9AGAM|nr:hypothetical protein Clacol_010089 [Clathrus columnatus]
MRKLSNHKILVLVLIFCCCGPERKCGWPRSPSLVNVVVVSVHESTATTPNSSGTYKAWGSYENFMLSYGLRPDDFDDVEEGKAIIRGLRDADEAERREDRRRKQKSMKSRH